MRAAALVALILPLVPAAAKQPPVRILSNQEATADCGAISNILGALRHRYGERVLWWGDTANGVTMVLTQRSDGKTWTLLAVHRGTACMVSSGGEVGAEQS